VHLAKRYFDQAAEQDTQARIPRDLALLILQLQQYFNAYITSSSTSSSVDLAAYVAEVLHVLQVADGYIQSVLDNISMYIYKDIYTLISRTAITSSSSSTSGSRGSRTSRSASNGGLVQNLIRFTKRIFTTTSTSTISTNGGHRGTSSNTSGANTGPLSLVEELSLLSALFALLTILLMVRYLT
jgi:hypothetical protein